MLVHLISIIIQFVLLLLRRASSIAAPQVLLTELQPDFPLLALDVTTEPNSSLEPVFMVWLPLYLVFAFSFSDLNFHEQENYHLTFQCSLPDPCFIKKVEKIKDTSYKGKSKHQRKISRDSVTTNYSDESFLESHTSSKESPSTVPEHVVFQKAMNNPRGYITIRNFINFSLLIINLIAVSFKDAEMVSIYAAVFSISKNLLGIVKGMVSKYPPNCMKRRMMELIACLSDVFSIAVGHKILIESLY
eukprot:TRINITY_DN10104_c0_g2_i3.p1 TRINITY_DN10104_c0_g2~~TRINITY_DN10104_c0_g2_i3.p1  ORF type:complete len:246 (+),score=3.15 TRINITY_DN10104_c0_g2_i3:3-740(+)